MGPGPSAGTGEGFACLRVHTHTNAHTHPHTVKSMHLSGGSARFRVLGQPTLFRGPQLTWGGGPCFLLFQGRPGRGNSCRDQEVAAAPWSSQSLPISPTVTKTPLVSEPPGIGCYLETRPTGQA